MSRPVAEGRESGRSRTEVLKAHFASGPRRAEDYLALCLHEPGFGYYASRARLGTRGDFATAATLGTGLARAVAAWIRRYAPRRGPVAVIEIGPGDGSLAEAVLASLPWRLRRRVQLHLVEPSPVLASLQQARLGRKLAGCHHHPGEALEACGGRALIFSNELVDAFAPAVLEWRDARWLEVHLSAELDNTSLRLRESCLPCPARRIAELDSVALDPGAWPQGEPPDTQRIEIAPAYRRWLAAWRPQFRAGRLLTIDYGAPFPALYERRLRGTLRAYRHHQRLEGMSVWGSPGRQDITFDVNFTDLQRWHSTLGLTGTTTPLDQWAHALDSSIPATDPVRSGGGHFRVREDSGEE